MEEGYRIAILDDEESAIEILGSAISAAFLSHGVKCDLAKFSSPKALESSHLSSPFSLLFLDIRLNGEDGIEFAKELRKKGDETDIIFVSSCEERVFEAFAVHPFGFIRKGNFLKDASEIIASYVKAKKENEASNLIVQTQNNTLTLTLPVFEIVYIESYKRIQSIFLQYKEKPIIIHSTMEKLEETLSPNGFIRVHKGFIVNYRFIAEIGSDLIKLTTGGSIPVNKRNVRSIREQFLSLAKAGNSLII